MNAIFRPFDKFRFGLDFLWRDFDLFVWTSPERSIQSWMLREAWWELIKSRLTSHNHETTTCPVRFPYNFHGGEENRLHCVQTLVCGVRWNGFISSWLRLTRSGLGRPLDGSRNLLFCCGDSSGDVLGDWSHRYQPECSDNFSFISLENSSLFTVEFSLRVKLSTEIRNWFQVFCFGVQFRTRYFFVLHRLDLCWCQGYCQNAYS